MCKFHLIVVGHLLWLALTSDGFSLDLRNLTLGFQANIIDLKPLEGLYMLNHDSSIPFVAHVFGFMLKVI